MPKKLLFPEAVRDFLVRRFNNHHQNWLAGDGTWPLEVGLGVPTQKDVAEEPSGVREWVAAWTARTGAGDVVWEERQFARLGTQRFPASCSLATPAAVAAAVGQGKRWHLASERYERMVGRWPALTKSTALMSKFNVLADYSAEDFERLFSLLAWLETNHASNLYLRQLPVEGLDTKWIEQRTGVVTSLLRVLRGSQESVGFFELCGLTKPPHRVRIRLLCPEVRQSVGGLRDIEAPVSELAALPITPAAVVVVENQETGLALPDMAGTVSIMKLGNAVSTLDVLPWLRGVKAVYWGDIDTHGYAILALARRVLPELQSVLMDEATLLAHRPLWGQEAVQCSEVKLGLLHDGERAVYAGLRANTWGPKLRLEQERLPWDLAVKALIAALSRGAR